MTTKTLHINFPDRSGKTGSDTPTPKKEGNLFGLIVKNIGLITGFLYFISWVYTYSYYNYLHFDIYILELGIYDIFGYSWVVLNYIMKYVGRYFVDIFWLLFWCLIFAVFALSIYQNIIAIYNRNIDGFLSKHERTKLVHDNGKWIIGQIGDPLKNIFSFINIKSIFVIFSIITFVLLSIRVTQTAAKVQAKNTVLDRSTHIIFRFKEPAKPDSPSPRLIELNQKKQLKMVAATTSWFLVIYYNKKQVQKDCHDAGENDLCPTINSIPFAIESFMIPAREVIAAQRLYVRQ